MPIHDSSMDFGAPEDNDLNLSLISEIDLLPDMGIDFNFDSAMLDFAEEEDNVSVDSAVGSSPPHVSVGL